MDASNAKSKFLKKWKIIGIACFLVFAMIIAGLNSLGGSNKDNSNYLNTDQFECVYVQENAYLYTYYFDEETSITYMYVLLNVDVGEKHSIELKVWKSDSRETIQRDKDNKITNPSMSGESILHKKIDYSFTEKAESEEEAEKQANKYRYKKEYTFSPGTYINVYVIFNDNLDKSKFTLLWE